MTDSWSMTDSTWFWAASFSAVALLGLFVVSPKYAVREASWEQKLITRSGIQRPDLTADEASTGKMPVPSDQRVGETPSDDSPQSNLLVPLWRLKALAAVAWLFSLAMMWRQVRQRGALTEHSP